MSLDLDFKPIPNILVRPPPPIGVVIREGNTDDDYRAWNQAVGLLPEATVAIIKPRDLGRLR